MSNEVRETLTASQGAPTKQQVVKEEKVETKIETSKEAEQSEGILSDGENKFLETFPEEYRKEPALQHFKDMKSFTKSYLHGQKEIGSRIRIPTKEADENTRKEFYEKVKHMPGLIALPDEKDPEYNQKVEDIYNKLGRPAKPEDYKFSLPEELPADEEFQGKVKDIAHKIGLNQNQLDALTSLETERAISQKKLLQEQKKNVSEYFKEKWGKDFTNNLSMAKLALKKYEEKYPAAVSDIREGYAGTSPVVIEMLYDMALSTKEDQTMAVNENSKSEGLTPNTASDRIRSIREDKNHPYNIAGHPEHEKAVEEVYALYQLQDQKVKDNQ